MKVRTLMLIHTRLEAGATVAAIAAETGISTLEIRHIRDERNGTRDYDAAVYHADMAEAVRCHDRERNAAARAAL